MGGLYLLFASKIGYGSGYFEYAFVGTCREVKALHHLLEHGGTSGIELGIGLHVAATHLCVAMHTWLVLKASVLPLSGR